MSSHKKQHTVPTGYLSQWSKEGQLSLYDLPKQVLHNRGVPKKILRANNIYSWDDFEGEDRLIIEKKVIGTIEDEALPLIREVQHHLISHKERGIISRFIALQALRIKKIKEDLEILHLAVGQECLIDCLKDPEKRKDLLVVAGKDKQFVEDLAKNPEKFVPKVLGKLKMSVKNIREIWLQIMLSSLEDMTERYYYLDWRLLQAGRRRAFITSDNPVVVISSVSRAHKATKEHLRRTEITFPLSPNFLLFMRDNREKTRKTKPSFYKVEASESCDSVRELNYRTAMHADRYIIADSDRLLLRISKEILEDWRDIRYGTKADIEKRLKGEIPVRSKPKNPSVKLMSREYLF